MYILIVIGCVSIAVCVHGIVNTIKQTRAMEKQLKRLTHNA